MPSMTSERAAAFDQAFSRPDARPLSDQQIGKLTALIDTVERMNLLFGSVDFRTPDGVKTVSPRVCEICGCLNPDCEHTRQAKALVNYAIELDALDFQDHAEEQAEHAAMRVGA